MATLTIICQLTPMLLVANCTNTKWWENPEKLLKPWHMGTHLKVLSESYPMNSNITGLRWFSVIFVSLHVLWTNVASALKGLKTSEYRKFIVLLNLQYRHLTSAPVDRTSANACLYKTPCYDVKEIIQTHQCQM